MLRNKTAIECLNMLKYEIESIINQFGPWKKRSKKKHVKRRYYKYRVQANYVEGL